MNGGDQYSRSEIAVQRQPQGARHAWQREYCHPAAIRRRYGCKPIFDATKASVRVHGSDPRHSSGRVAIRPFDTIDITATPFWLNTVSRLLKMPISGRDCDTRFSITSVSHDRVSPG